jgi:uncharacterized membrane protein YecN with MAPEG domain
MALDREQRGIRNGALLALTTAIAVISVCTTLEIGLAEFSDLRSGMPQLAFAAGMLAVSLAVAIGRLGNDRFVEPLDRNAAASETATPIARQYQAILTNTHEQATLAMLVYLIAAFTLPQGWTDCIAAGSLLFVAGRLFFTVGYSRGASSRAFGFGLTFYPTIILAVLSLIAALV